jgi:hypothetical protein
MMDADDIFNNDTGTSALSISVPWCDSYALRIKRGNAEYWRSQFFSTTREWVYHGAMHEYADIDGTVDVKGLEKRGTLPDAYWLDARCEGSRSADPDKYRKDAQLLDAVLRADPTDTRSQFYAAQSWRDAGEQEKALTRYVLRYDMKKGYSEERYVSMLNAVRLAPTFADAVAFAWKAVEANPKRREATCALLRRSRAYDTSILTQDLVAMAMYTDAVASRTMQASFLFGEADVYAWRFADEYSILCFYTGHKTICKTQAQLALPNAPEAQHSRIRGNIAAADV